MRLKVSMYSHCQFCCSTVFDTFSAFPLLCVIKALYSLLGWDRTRDFGIGWVKYQFRLRYVFTQDVSVMTSSTRKLTTKSKVNYHIRNCSEGIKFFIYFWKSFINYHLNFQSCLTFCFRRKIQF